MLTFTPEPLFGSLERNEIENLISNVENCESLIICVAYLADWKDCNRLDEALVKKLKNEHSYIIVDPANPTSHGYCNRLSSAGGLIYFAEKKLKRGEVAYSRLMHTKIYIFDFGSEVEIWIGSMNFTREGITGENLECALKYRCKKDNLFYERVFSYVEYIKNVYCSIWPKDGDGLKLIDLYKKRDPDFNRFLGDLENCILFVTDDINKFDLQIGTYINIFFLGDKVADLKKGSSYTLIIHDAKQRIFFNANCKITQIADIDNGKTDVEIADPKPFVIHHLVNKDLYLFEKSLFSKFQRNPYVKSFVTLQINNEIRPILNLFKPIEKEEFYTNIVDSSENRITNFQRILELKGNSKVKSEVYQPKSIKETPEDALNKLLIDLDNYNSKLSADLTENLFYKVDFTKKIKVLNDFLVDRLNA